MVARARRSVCIGVGHRVSPLLRRDPFAPAHVRTRQASPEAVAALSVAVEQAVAEGVQVSTRTVDVFVRESLFPSAIRSSQRRLEAAAMSGTEGMVSWGNTNAQVRWLALSAHDRYFCVVVHGLPAAGLVDAEPHTPSLFRGSAGYRWAWPRPIACFLSDATGLVGGSPAREGLPLEPRACLLSGRDQVAAIRQGGGKEDPPRERPRGVIRISSRSLLRALHARAWRPR